MTQTLRHSLFALAVFLGVVTGARIARSTEPLKDEPAAEKDFWIPGRNVVYIIDTTASMLGKLDVLVDKLNSNALDRLGPEHTIQLIAVNQEIKTSSEHPVRCEGKARTEAKKFLQTLVVRGSAGEQMGKAFRKALESHPDAIVFLTDDDAGEDEYESVKQAISKSNVPVHVACYGESDSNYAKIAKETGGAYKRFSRRDDR